MDNDKEFRYVSHRLREYKKEFGRYPHPLGLNHDDLEIFHDASDQNESVSEKIDKIRVCHACRAQKPTSELKKCGGCASDPYSRTFYCDKDCQKSKYRIYVVFVCLCVCVCIYISKCTYR